LRSFLDAAHNVAGFNDYEKGQEHGLSSLSIPWQAN